MIGRRCLLLSLPLLFSLAGIGAQAAAARPVQYLGPSERGMARLETEHFELVYSPRKVTAAEAGDAERLAEAAWTRCNRLMSAPPAPHLRIDLTPNFLGATGFYRPGNSSSRDPNQRPMIGVRYGDLPYLGLSGEYVLTHEIGHAFSADIAGSSLGEGVADWAAGTYAGIPMEQWWAQALQSDGLWINPEAFFITGNFESRPEVDAVIRTAQYAESGLLVQFLVNRFGWTAFHTFAKEYGAARGTLDSNEDRRLLPAPRRYRPNAGPRADEPDPRVPPDASAVRATFQRNFGQSWEHLREAWEAQIRAAKQPAGAAERLVLSYEIYGAIRNCEMWMVRNRVSAEAEDFQPIREAFTKANSELAQGHVSEARKGLTVAKSRMELLRHPRDVAQIPIPARRLLARNLQQ